MEKNSIQERAYRKYQLDWMMSHGHSARELFKYVFCHHVDGIDPDGGDYESQDVLQLNPDDLFDAWEADAGFDGELWASGEEFLQAEFLDEAYMNSILSADEYAEYIHAVHGDKT